MLSSSVPLPSRCRARALEFSLGGHAQPLTFDPRRWTLRGVLKGVISIGLLDSVSGADRASASSACIAAAATAELEIRFPSGAPTVPAGSEVADATAQISFRIRGAPNRPSRIGGPALAPISIETQSALASFVVGGFGARTRKRFRVQPIFLVESHDDASPTGLGFRFGIGFANVVWRKVGIDLDVANPVVVVAPHHKDFVAILRDGTNNVGAGQPISPNGITALSRIWQAPVDTPAIRVFFVRRLINLHDSSVVPWGGGRTFLGGRTDAYVITSDEIVPTAAERAADRRARTAWEARHPGRPFVSALNFHSLAHELGHAIGFNHPDRPDDANQRRGSGGSIMCPSGVAADNPSINSEYHYGVAPGRHDVSFELGPWDPECDGIPGAADPATSDCGRCSGGL